MRPEDKLSITIELIIFWTDDMMIVGIELGKVASLFNSFDFSSTQIASGVIDLLSDWRREVFRVDDRFRLMPNWLRWLILFPELTNGLFFRLPRAVMFAGTIRPRKYRRFTNVTNLVKLFHWACARAAVGIFQGSRPRSHRYPAWRSDHPRGAIVEKACSSSIGNGNTIMDERSPAMSNKVPR